MPTEATPGSGPRARGPLALALVAAALWLGFLLVLAAKTANPVTLNREQLLAADAVVSGLVERQGDSVVWLLVERRLAGSETPSRIRLQGPGTDRLTHGRRFLLPIDESGGRYSITPTTPLKLERAPAGIVASPDPDGERGTPYIYPAADEVLATAARILSAAAPRAYR